ncbi:MAG: hypothetical protein A2W62_02135 [Alphaproteobacteria bacterium RIFCSPLOWO2_02_42_7]|nr:MAG: hypothetical protein A2W62_02135 [Alphaproteobacteria bacterium RIFCSPLOWO2_02_42_7]
MNNTIRRYIVPNMFAIGMCVFAGSAGAFDLGGMLKQVEKTVQQQQQQSGQPPVQQEPHGQPVQQQPIQQTVQQPQQSQINSTEAPQVSAAQTQKEQEIEAWINNPNGAFPRNLTPKDKDNLVDRLYNMTFAALNSPELKKFYTDCKNKEFNRISKNIQSIREKAKNASTFAERDNALKSANETEKYIGRLAPASCFVRIHKRALSALGLGSNVLEGTMTLGDLGIVANALDKKKFTSKFYSDIASELPYDHDEWMNLYVLKEAQGHAKELVDESKSSSERRKNEVMAEQLTGLYVAKYNAYHAEAMNNLITGNSIIP